MMTPEDVLRLISNFTILAIGLVLLTFMVIYARFFNWRKTAGGRSVMYLVGSLSLLVALSAFLTWVDFFSVETEQLLRFEVYLTIFAATVHMLGVLIRRWWTTGEFKFDVETRQKEDARAE